MFENVGEKIRNYAKGLFIVQVILYIIGGIVMLAESDGEGGLIVGGIALLAFGWVIAWLDSVFIYGFGELIVKATEIARNTRNGEENSNENTIAAETESGIENNEKMPKKTIHQWRCDKCGNMISQDPCPVCSKKPKEVPYWCLKCNHEGPYNDRCPSCGSSLKVYNTK